MTGYVFGNGGTIFPGVNRLAYLSTLYNTNQKAVIFHRVTLDWPVSRMYVQALEYQHLISVVIELIDNMLLPSLDIDIIVAYKYLFTWKKCRVTSSVRPEND